MALTRITRGVIKPNENYDTHNIVSTGIVTSVGLDVNGNADVSGSLSVGGVLTYEDVTSIDSIGIITARSGIDADDFISVGSNIHLGNAGVVTATSFVGSGAALTGIDATSIKDSGGNVKIQAQASGAIHSGVSTFQDIDVDGHTNLDNVSVAGVTTFSDNDIHFKNNGITSCRFDSNQGAFHFNHSGGLFWYKNGNLSNSSGATIFYSEFSNQYKGLVIQAPWQGQNNAKNVTVMGSSNGRFYVQNNLNAQETFSAYFEGGVHLGYYQSGNKLSTTQTGVTLNQDLTVNRNALITGISTFTGAIDANGDLDVDGHTNLDNVSVAGILTTSGGLNVSSGTLDVATQIRKSSGTLDYLAATHAFSNVAGSERLRIDSGGRILKGLTTARGNYGNNASGVEYGFQIEGTSAIAAGLSIVRNSNDANDGGIVLGKTRATSNGGNTVVQAGDDLGNLTFAGNDGSTMLFGAEIFAEVQSGVGNDDMPADLIFKTNGGSTSTTERLRINASGHVVPGADSTYDLGLTGTRFRNVYADTLYGDGSNLTGIAADKIFEGNTEVETVDTGSDGHVKITTEGSERLRIDNTGWMGAGQTSRDHVGQVAAFKNTSNTNSWLSVNVNNNTGIGGVVFGDSDTWAPAYIQYNHSSNIMQFISNGSERLRIKSNGQIVLGIDGSNSELTFSQDGSTGVVLSSTTTGFGGYNTFTVNSAQFVHKYGANERLRIDSAGQVLPGADDSQNLGSSTKRWANIYAADMHFSNEGKTNDVDGTWGDWTLQEGEDSIFMINNRTGKKYSITMKEIN